MNISKADAIAHLSKWCKPGIRVRATYRTITGNAFIVGTIEELSSAVILIKGNDCCEMVFYFRGTSEYEYTDTREPASESYRNRENKYPTVIDVKFSGGEHLNIVEFFDD
jgi:hypothetical protein